MQVQEQVEMSEQEKTEFMAEQIRDAILYGRESETVNQKIAGIRKYAIKNGLKDAFDYLYQNLAERLSDQIESNRLNIHLIYTKEDFADSQEPYLEIIQIDSPFERQQRIQQLSENAKAVGYVGFMKMYKEFVKTMREVNPGGTGGEMSPTLFPYQPIELDGGEWLCNEKGVKRVGAYFDEVACCHPIMPVERLVNIDTGEEKLKIAFAKDGRRWRNIVYGKDVLFVASKITQLAAVGVAVTSENAKSLVKFLCDIENRNYNVLPEHSSVGRLGYVGEDHIFSPYQPDLIFDGESSYSEVYKAIRPQGSYETWLATAVQCRRESKTAQILLAASFASVLLCHVGALPFFVHLWGVESGTGKTVGLMLAASVWGDPAIGRYVQTFNATQVSQERTAAFLNNIPLCIDELQLQKDSHGKSRFDVYQLAQGVGRGRGNKAGGVDRTPTWSLCILTTGESPIVQSGAGAGAVNRVIDIECRTEEAVIRDGMAVSSVIKQNFGYAGKAFLDGLTPEKIEEAKAEYSVQFKALSSRDTTEKQAMAAAMLLVADKLADDLIFHTGERLSVDEIAQFLQTKASVSAGERGYQYMCDWVALHANKFSLDNENGEVYGVLENGWAYINASVFRSAAQDAGYDSRALLSWMKTKKVILTRGRNLTRGKRIHGVNTECVVMQLPGASTYETELPEDSIERDLDDLL